MTNTKHLLVRTASGLASAVLAIALLCGYLYRPLDEEQSVGAVFQIRNGIPWNAFRRASPSCRDRLYDVLADARLRRYHGNAYRLLGTVGDESDLTRITEFIDQVEEELDEEGQQCLRGAIHGLALLAKKDCPGAREQMAGMCTLEYAAKITLEGHDYPPRQKVGGLTSQLEFLVWCFQARALTGEKLTESRDDIVAKIEDPTLRATVADRVSPSRLSEIRWHVRWTEWWPISARERDYYKSVYDEHFAVAEPIDDTSEARISPVTEQEVLAMIARGDSDIVPQLRRWLLDDKQGAYFAHAVDGLSKFGDRVSLKSLKAVAEDVTVALPLRQRAAVGVARLYGRDAIKELTEMVWNDQLPLAGRCEAAFRLWQFGDDLGGQFLLQQYDLHRLERKTTNSWKMDSVRDVLERIYDQDLIGALKDRLASETDFTMQNNINTLITRMRVNDESINTLKELTANTMWTHAAARYAALEVLGAKGNSSLIPFLESLEPFEGERVPPLQHRLFKERTTEAIGGIRRREWSIQQRQGKAQKAEQRDRSN